MTSDTRSLALPPLLVVAGATATGKTGLSLRLAEALGASGVAAEIVSADSRQVYRGMDVGTAKVSAVERARVPHHGLDLVDPDEGFSVADYAAHARAALAGISERGALALLVGGTGLYLRAVARGLDTDALPSDAATRARVEDGLANEGLAAGAARLQALAPGLASRTDLANPRRVARALEIAELGGDLVPPAPRGYAGSVGWLGLSLEKAELNRRIAERAAGQFAGGLLDEAARLLARYPRELRAFSAIGYPEAFAVLDGTLSLADALAATTRRTVAFAKRQRTWFRAEPGIEWVDATVDDPLPRALALAERLLDAR